MLFIITMSLIVHKILGLCAEDNISLVGCDRFSSSKPNRETNMQDPQSFSPGSQKLNCTEAELNKSACQHGGICFATKAPGRTRDWGCDCPKPYVPPRCHDIDANTYWNVISDNQRSTNVAIAGMAVSVFAVVLCLTIIICIAVYLQRRKMKKTPNKETKTEQGDQNGDAEPLQSRYN